MGLLSKAITVQVPVGGHPKQPGGAEAVRNMVRGYWLQNPSFQGIVLEPPKYAGEAGDEKFFEAAASMTASFGRAVCLPSKNVLILFSKAGDRELLTHRMVKTLRTRALASFEAESPEEALFRIQSCL
jgi:hypothetical protein